MSIEQNASNTLETLLTRFSSSNSIPVERATIKSSEFDDILLYISKLKAELQQSEQTLSSCEHQLGIARGA